jgi:hypothetical protein
MTRRGRRRDVAAVDVEGAVGVGAGQPFGGGEENPTAGGWNAAREEARVRFAVATVLSGAAGVALRDEDRAVFFYVADVDVFLVVGVAGDHLLFGREEDFRPVAGDPIVM